MTKHTVLISGAILALTLLAYLLFWPVPVDPVAWSPPPLPELRGPYAHNTRLGNVQPLGKGTLGVGPEDVAFDARGRLYTGLKDGRIMRFNPLCRLWACRPAYTDAVAGRQRAGHRVRLSAKPAPWPS